MALLLDTSWVPTKRCHRQQGRSSSPGQLDTLTTTRFMSSPPLADAAMLGYAAGDHRRLTQQGGEHGT